MICARCCRRSIGTTTIRCGRTRWHVTRRLRRPITTWDWHLVRWQAGRRRQSTTTGRALRIAEARFRICPQQPWRSLVRSRKVRGGDRRIPGGTTRYKSDYFQAFNNLGLALADSGHVDDAIVLYRKALEINPDYESAQINLGKALAGSGNVSDAIALYRKALDSNPNSAQVHLNLGAALANGKRDDEAIDHFQKALKIDPELAEAHYNLGNALSRRQKLPEAIDHYRTALKIKPDYFEAHNNLGLCLANRREVVRRRDHPFREGPALIKPDFFDAHVTLWSSLGRTQRHRRRDPPLPNGPLDLAAACKRTKVRNR